MPHEHTLSCLDRGPHGEVVCKLDPGSKTPAAGRPARRNPGRPVQKSAAGPTDLQKIVPAGSQGSAAVVEDGRIVIYEVAVMDYGCEQIVRRPTRVRIYSAGLDPSSFPAKAGWDPSHGFHGAFYVEMPPTFGSTPRRLHIRWDDLDKDSFTMVRSVLPDKLVHEKELTRRWWKIRHAVEARGGRIHTAWISRGRATAAMREVFHRVAGLALAGKSEDEIYDLVMAEMGERADAFFSVININWRNPMGPKDLFILETSAQKTITPQDMHGEVPRIDWCEPGPWSA